MKIDEWWDAIESRSYLDDDDIRVVRFEDLRAIVLPIPTREQIIAALSDLNYDERSRVDDIVPRGCFDAVADAVSEL